MLYPITIKEHNPSDPKEARAFKQMATANTREIEETPKYREALDKAPIKFVAIDNATGRPVGFACALVLHLPEKKEEELHLLAGYVRPKYRKKEIWTRLFSRARHEAEKRGVSVLSFHYMSVPMQRWFSRQMGKPGYVRSSSEPSPRHPSLVAWPRHDAQFDVTVYPDKPPRRRIDGTVTLRRRPRK